MSDHFKDQFEEAAERIQAEPPDVTTVVGQGMRRRNRYRFIVGSVSLVVVILAGSIAFAMDSWIDGDEHTPSNVASPSNQEPLVRLFLKSPTASRRAFEGILELAVPKGLACLGGWSEADSILIIDNHGETAISLRPNETEFSPDGSQVCVRDVPRDLLQSLVDAPESFRFEAERDGTTESLYLAKYPVPFCEPDEIEVDFDAHRSVLPDDSANSHYGIDFDVALDTPRDCEPSFFVKIDDRYVEPISEASTEWTEVEAERACVPLAKADGILPYEGLHEVSVGVGCDLGDISVGEIKASKIVNAGSPADLTNEDMEGANGSKGAVVVRGPDGGGLSWEIRARRVGEEWCLHVVSDFGTEPEVCFEDGENDLSFAETAWQELDKEFAIYGVVTGDTASIIASVEAAPWEFELFRWGKWAFFGDFVYSETETTGTEINSYEPSGDLIETRQLCGDDWWQSKGTCSP